MRGEKIIWNKKELKGVLGMIKFLLEAVWVD